MSDFQIIVSSASQGPFQLSNKLNGFSNQLNSEISLETPYTIAIKQIILPTSVQNVTECSFSYYSYTYANIYYVKISDGSYQSIEAIIDIINTQLTSTKDIDYYEVGKQRISMSKLILEITSPSRDKNMSSFELSLNLGNILGFNTGVYKTGTYIGKPFDINHSCHSMYVTSDIVKGTNVGSSFIPLLLVVPYVKNNGEQTSFSPAHLSYHLVKSKFISTISIKILNSNGHPFPFTGVGEVIVCLEFKTLE